MFMFDHTCDGPPEDNPYFRFYKKMIGPNEGPGTASIESALRDHGAPERRNVLKKLTRFIGEQGGANNSTAPPYGGGIAVSYLKKDSV